MIQNEQILEYIDGVLDPDAEQTLFDAMARQPELRSALRQFIVIGDAVRADREAYTPPADVERALMSQLGLGSLAPYAAAPAAAGWLSRLFSFGGRFWGMMLSFLLGALLAGTTVIYVTSNAADSPLMADHPAGSIPPAGERSSSDATRNDLPGGAGAVKENGAGKNMGDKPAGMNRTETGAEGAGGNGITRLDRSQGTGGNLKESRRDELRDVRERRGSSERFSSDRSRSERMLGNGAGTVDANGASISDGAGSRLGASASLSDRQSAEDPSGRGSGLENDPRRIVTEAPLRAVDRRPELAMEPDRERPASHASHQMVPIAGTFREDPEDRTGSITLEARLNLGGSYTPNNAMRSPSPTDNLIGGVFFHPAGRLAVGMELGKESYDQTLYGISDDTVQVEQRPSYMWLGGTARLHLGELPFNGIETFVQGTAAYSTGGPIVRLRLGGRMPVSPAWDITLGVETSGLIYTFQDRQFLSGRWGISGGVQWMLR